MQAVIFDLDGVLRLPIDSAEVNQVENRWALRPGEIESAARSADVLEDLILGRQTRAEWVDHVGEAIGSLAAAREWAALPLELDSAVARIADRLHKKRVLTAILTNGTDTVRQEIVDLGIRSSFTAVFNSAELGIKKPDPRIYQHVLDHLGVPAAQALMVDDSRDKLKGAALVGMRTHWFRDAEGLSGELQAAGLLD